MTVTGTATAAQVGTHRVVATANDTFATVSNTLTITINENHPPTKPATFTSTINVNEGIAGVHTIEAYTDIQGDSITYALTKLDGSALDASWVSFNSANRQISYNVTASLSNPTSLKLTVSDPYNTPLTETIQFIVNYAPKNNASVVFRTGEFLCLSLSTTQIDKNVLYDDGGISSYTVKFANGSATPSWLTVKAPSVSPSGHWEFSGIYPTYEEVTLEFTIEATDTYGLKGTANFFIDVVSKFSSYQIVFSLSKIIV